MIRLAVLITAVLAVAAATSLLDHSGPAAHSSKQQKKTAAEPELLIKKDLELAAGAGKQEEAELKQLAKRWGSRFSKARARSHGEQSSAVVNERVSRDYLDDDDDDFRYDDDEGIDYRQTRDYTHLLGFPSLSKVLQQQQKQQQHKLASRGILASGSEEVNNKRSAALEENKRSTLGEVSKKRSLGGGLVNNLSGHQAEVKRKARNDKVEYKNKLLERDSVGTIDNKDGIRKVARKENQGVRVSRDYLGVIFGGGGGHDRVSRDYFGGILGGDEDQKRVSRDYVDFIKEGEEQERESRDYLYDILGGGGLGERVSRDY